MQRIIVTQNRDRNHLLKEKNFIRGNHSPLERWGWRGNSEEAAYWRTGQRLHGKKKWSGKGVLGEKERRGRKGR